tara:strand:+ start:514 stop:1479 length:966 start_codon:yes stop_codon:yes gene_type:complete
MSNSFDKKESESKNSIWVSLKNIRMQMHGVFSRDVIDTKELIELEEILILSDAGPQISAEIAENIRNELKNSKNRLGPKGCLIVLRNLIEKRLEKLVDPNHLSQSILTEKQENPLVSILIVGVNGSGKTTTIGKLASYYKAGNLSVALAACDTFRAAANEQLISWGENNSVEVFSSRVVDPAAAAFEAIKTSKEKKIDILFVDTAGRLPNNKNLIEELKKIRRVMSKANNGSQEHTWIVIDCNTGQNAISQIRKFREAVDITGIILTKFDGINKAGFLLQLSKHEPIPIIFVGTGEKITDIAAFSPEIISSGIVGLDSMTE